MPSAEDTFANAFVVTGLRTGGRTFVGAPFGRGGVGCVHPSVHHRWGACLVFVLGYYGMNIDKRVDGLTGSECNVRNLPDPSAGNICVNNQAKEVCDIDM